MNKLIALVAALAFAVGAQTYYGGTNASGVKTLGIPFSAFLDVQVAEEDTAYSQVFDLLSTPVADSLGVKSVRLGALIVSCFDVSDSAAVDDSVLVKAAVQTSQYAADNNNPGLSRSDAWNTAAANEVTLADVSNTNTVVEGSVASVDLQNADLDRFARLRVINTSDAAKNTARCRVYWVAKK